MQLTYIENDYQDSLYFSAIAERGYTFRYSENWATSAPCVPLDEFAYILDVHYENDWMYALLDAEIAIVLITLNNGKVGFRVAAANDTDCRDVIKSYRDLFPKAVGDTSTIPVQFWTSGPNGSGMERQRTLEAPVWDDISENYPDAVRAQVEAMFSATFSNMAGKLILWHGEPGVGKTTAIRALGQAWRSWASLHYILDPERFFGDAAQYMLNVLLDERQSWVPYSSTAKPWRVIVLEDTGELLTKDAKLTAGQGLSRLLNVCDGMVGQGLNILVLITSNEDIGTMHPAVVRPGRCAANIAFTNFKESEARAWMAAHDADYPVDSIRGSKSLATLYALLSGDTIQSVAKPQFGF